MLGAIVPAFAAPFRRLFCAMSILSVKDLQVDLGDATILHDVGFHVAAGTWVGLIGPNGSGKTTLLRTISGVLPFRGSIRLWNRPLRGWKPRDLARRLAFVRQAPTMTFDFTVEQYVLLGRTAHKSWLSGYNTDDRARAYDALEQVDLGGFADRSVLSLSGGEQQRVVLAQALAQEAAFLLLDEPTAHLDVHFQYEFLHLIANVTRQGRTVVAVFHDLEQAARFADTLLVLHEGTVVAEGLPNAVLTESLIADVFRMEARVTEDATPLHIDYIAPLGRGEPSHGRDR
jgi:iron complex transport system ATP-binding protein